AMALAPQVATCVIYSYRSPFPALFFITRGNGSHRSRNPIAPRTNIEPRSAQRGMCHCQRIVRGSYPRTTVEHRLLGGRIPQKIMKTRSQLLWRQKTTFFIQVFAVRCGLCTRDMPCLGI